MNEIYSKVVVARVKRSSARLPHDQGLTVPLTGLSGGSSRGQQAQLANGKPAFLKQLKQLLAHSSAGTEDGHRERSVR